MGVFCFKLRLLHRRHHAEAAIRTETLQRQVPVVGQLQHVRDATAIAVVVEDNERPGTIDGDVGIPCRKQRSRESSQRRRHGQMGVAHRAGRGR